MKKIDDVFEKLEFYIVDEDNHIQPNDEDLNKLEKTLGTKLSQEYRYLLKNYGGTALNKGGIFTAKDKHPYGKNDEVDSFLGFSKDDEMTFPALLRDYQERIPPDMIPFAMDSYGNLLLLGIAGKINGEVWLWDHEYRAVSGQIDKMVAELKAKKVDVSTLDLHQIINTWEDQFEDKLTKPKRFSNMYQVADTLTDFLNDLKPDPELDE